jgi:hypothetical protein
LGSIPLRQTENHPQSQIREPRQLHDGTLDTRHVESVIPA